MAVQRSKITKRMGNEISRLIQVARDIKAEANHNGQPAPPAVAVVSYEAMKNALVEAIEERDKWQQKYERCRRDKLANFSIEDIEAELQRRVDAMQRADRKQRYRSVV